MDQPFHIDRVRPGDCLEAPFGWGDPLSVIGHLPRLRADRPVRVLAVRSPYVIVTPVPGGGVGNGVFVIDGRRFDGIVLDPDLAGDMIYLCRESGIITAEDLLSGLVWKDFLARRAEWLNERRGGADIDDGIESEGGHEDE
jgi:hypothetical protein